MLYAVVKDQDLLQKQEVSRILSNLGLPSRDATSGDVPGKVA